MSLSLLTLAYAMLDTLQHESFATPTEAARTEWENDSRWNGIVRDYTADDGERLRGSIDIKDSTEAAQFHD
jgi:isocitrate lyase